MKLPKIRKGYLKMLEIYSINNGTAYMIRLTGPKFTWTENIYNIAVEAQGKMFSSEKEAQEWINERL